MAKFKIEIETKTNEKMKFEFENDFEMYKAVSTFKDYKSLTCFINDFASLTVYA